MSVLPRLNGYDVPVPLRELMLRPDWAGKRTSEAWLSKFGSPASGFVEFCGLDHLERENKAVRNPELKVLCGAPDSVSPPGDFDPERGFIIGFTEHVDDAICVDLRPCEGPRIIFYNHRANGFTTAFETLEMFHRFYREQHG